MNIFFGEYLATHIEEISIIVNCSLQISLRFPADVKRWNIHIVHEILIQKNISRAISSCGKSSMKSPFEIVLSGYLTTKWKILHH